MYNLLQFGLITCTYIATTVFSLAITNNAAVTIMFPVALAAAQQQNLDFRPFAYILMMASSAGFMTPTGCATNIMVYTVGGYKFIDYLKYGGLLQVYNSTSLLYIQMYLILKCSLCIQIIIYKIQALFVKQPVL